MNPKNDERCANEGGCSMMTGHWFQQQIIRAFEAGYESGRESVKEPAKDSI